MDSVSRGPVFWLLGTPGGPCPRIQGKEEIKGTATCKRQCQTGTALITYWHVSIVHDIAASKPFYRCQYMNDYDTVSASSPFVSYAKMLLTTWTVSGHT